MFLLWIFAETLNFTLIPTFTFSCKHIPNLKAYISLNTLNNLQFKRYNQSCNIIRKIFIVSNCAIFNL